MDAEKECLLANASFRPNDADSGIINHATHGMMRAAAAPSLLSLSPSTPPFSLPPTLPRSLQGYLARKKQIPGRTLQYA